MGPGRRALQARPGQRQIPLAILPVVRGHHADVLRALRHQFDLLHDARHGRGIPRDLRYHIGDAGSRGSGEGLDGAGQALLVELRDQMGAAAVEWGDGSAGPSDLQGQ